MRWAIAITHIICLLVTKLQLGNADWEAPAFRKRSWSFPKMITKLELGNEQSLFLKPQS